ncbi:adenylosuccinate synthase [Kitasatospora camelliae]|uniref:Adenylosuccinate synthetase n=1 Tax=Kitasatospora camelliae TaxID=3156397 RepID=A0AAU8JQL8_9ACTN
MALHAVVGINWGDEGKGRMIDYLAREADLVVRYQGGNNAGHTVINEFGTFKLRLVPSGIFNPDTVNVIGPGTVLDLESLDAELAELRERSVDTSGLLISERATVCFPFHRDQDAWEEDRLADRPFGSTRRGIAPVYGDRYLKKALQLGELLDREHLRRRLAPVIEWKNLGNSALYPGKPPISLDAMVDWGHGYARRLRPHIGDVSGRLHSAEQAGRHIILEAQLGALRDILHGIYPYTSSSSSLAGYAPVGGGLPGRPLSRVTGVMKAFSTCVGEGPFVTEEFGAWADELRQGSGEYGVNTGRPRRIGPFDAVASRYGALIQGAHDLALTKLDSLSGLPELRVCTAYEIDGVKTADFPLAHRLDDARPVYEYLPGWDEDLTGIRDFGDLPRAAAAYVLRIEELVGVPIRYVSVGPERDQLIDRGPRAR